MGQIYQVGALNTTALTVPNLYVQIARPATILNGVTSGRIGVVGTASWGPINTPLTVGNITDYYNQFGGKAATSADMGIAVDVMMNQGASDFRCVRVTDGTDSAVITYPDENTCMSARWTGSQGKLIDVSISYPSVNVCQVDITHPYLQGEHYSFSCNGVGSYTWTQLSQALNGVSNLVMLITAPATGIAPKTFNLWANQPSGGSDGGWPTSSQFIGQDTTATNIAGNSAATPRTGIYSLRGMGCSIGVQLGSQDPSTWSAQSAFGMSEGIYMVASAFPAVTLATTVGYLASSGAASYSLKVMHGDWLNWNDSTFGVISVQPSIFAAGILASLSPEQSSLNKRLVGVVGSQKSGLSTNGLSSTYSDAELSSIFSAGIDVIAYPSPGGNYWSCRLGHNTSPNAANNGDNYTRLTNYIAETLASAMGQYVGAVINSGMLSDVRSTVLTFLGTLQDQAILGSVDGSIPYSVVCDASNNPQSRIALGYVQADIAVRYQGINEKFIVNLQGGNSVTVTQASGA